MPTQSKNKKVRKDPASKPGAQTVDITDPQEKMEGPVSSFMQNIKKGAKENDKETKQEADKKKEENM
jgi:hypothetical protein